MRPFSHVVNHTEFNAIQQKEKGPNVLMLREKITSWIFIFLMSLVFVGCPKTAEVNPRLQPCHPTCIKEKTCDQLDTQLLNARSPLLHCVGVEAKRGNLDRAHQCYRAIRLLENARWWYKSTLTRDEINAVYEPAVPITHEFLCRIEILSQSKTPEEVEQHYLEMIRSFP